MRFLADENFPVPAVMALRAIGHDVEWIGSVEHGASDESVFERGQGERRVVLTLDKDFGALAVLLNSQASRGVILFRVPGSSLNAVVSRVLATIETRTDWADYFTVVEFGRIRMRKLTG